VKILVGLGNPGEEYRSTRHNIGYLVAEEIRERRGAPREETQARSLLCRVDLGGSVALVARPLTYMNRSGEAVAALLERADAGAGDLLVICDDLHIEFGRIRLRARGSDGGHNGLRSIIRTLGTREFARLRIGIGPAGESVAHADFVLAPFRRSERAELERLVQSSADCAEAVVIEGIEKAMNRFNRTTRPGAAAAD
jgi:peptidyl-tRNA hydrolase, PTH1 family